jgi:TRAP-type mannitol/chloroaromatic compound transport system permease small subunit
LVILALFLIGLPYMASRHVRDLIREGLGLELRRWAGWVSLSGTVLFLLFGFILVCEPAWHEASMSFLGRESGGTVSGAGPRFMQECGRMLLLGALIVFPVDLIVVAMLERARIAG